ncbi:type I secretion C-terminal target domain-containing protein [Enterovibrio sp. ZSDZ42]|uniref:Type I secretion C-terminal target domain-containing protein n=1 Tax=Enterovibrio gelatinilyticus TaxID=2899819 RepID=A0ABT5R6D1_9GAMM|nr:type I secretion C-terminal target domain-containing protein [Enterovibrio sp. ZSDZ42]MDD1795765.1 type I secretion C-terminal target domain-containing protein [Enterovibrio sp. ZSDZ42]
MASKLIITQLNGEALIFASDGSVRVAEMYAELKPDEVLVTERGGAVLKENGEREINVGPNSGFLFEPPPNQDGDVLAARRGVEDGEDPSEGADPAAGEAATSATFFVAGNVVTQSVSSGRPSLGELLKDAKAEEGQSVESLSLNNFTAPQLNSLSTLRRFFLDSLNQNESNEGEDTLIDVASNAPPTSSTIPESSEPSGTIPSSELPDSDTGNGSPTVILSTINTVTEESVTEGQSVATITTNNTNGDSLTLSLINNEAGYFRIDDGQVVLTQTGVEAINNDELGLDALEVTIEASEGDWIEQTSGTVTVNKVNDNVPTLTVNATDITEESVVEGMVVATYTASDADGSTLTFTLTNNDNGYLSLQEGTVTLTAEGVAAINNDALSVESIAVNLTVSDGDFQTSASDLVVVSRVNDNAPSISLIATDLTEGTVAEGQTVATFSASDVDGGDLSFSLQNDTDNYFTIVGNQVQLTEAGVTAIQDDALDIRNMSISVMASDGDNQTTATDTLLVGRDNDNVPEISLTLNALTEEEVSESTLVATATVTDEDNDDITLSLTGNENRYFELVGNEVFLTSEGVAAINLDGINPLSSISLSVQASDGTFTTVATESVSVLRVNDNDPTISLNLSDVMEESVVDGQILATIVASDADNQDLDYRLQTDNPDWIEIVNNDVRLTADGVAAINDDLAELSSISFSVIADDGDRQSSADAVVTVNRVNDNAPEISLTVNELTEESVSENDVVAMFTASDDDEDALTYSLANNDSGYFTLSGSQVLLTAAGVAAINDDVAEVISLTVSVVADDGKYQARSDADITVNRVNDNAPEISLTVNELTEESVSENDVVATFTASDDDEDALTYSLANNDSGYFTLSGSQVLLTAAGVATINDDSIDSAITSMTFSVQAFDGLNTSSAPAIVSVTRVSDIVAVDDDDEIATLGTVKGNVITGDDSDSSGADILVSPDTVAVTSVSYQGTDYLLAGGVATITTDHGSLIVNEDGSYSYTSTVQTQFYASELNTAFDTSNGVTFLGSGLTQDIFLSGDANAGLDIDTLLNQEDHGDNASPENITDDEIDGGNGDDVLYGYGGNDTIDGGNGVDELHGGEGNDSLSGGNGKDILYGDGGNDTLDGGRGGDRLVGGEGDDTLILGNGPDVVVFESGTDTVEGFKNSNDSIVVKNATDTVSFSDLVMSQVGDDTHITLDTGTLILRDIDKEDLHAGHFTFEGAVVDGDYSATTYGFGDAIDQATFTLSGLNNNDTFDYYLYDDQGDLIGQGSSTYTGSDVIINAPAETSFRYIVLDHADIVVETLHGSLEAPSIPDDEFIYTLGDSNSNSAQANLTIRFDSDTRLEAQISNVQTAGLSGEINDAHIAKGNLLDAHLPSDGWALTAVNFEGATYSATEGVMVIETPHGSLTIYGQSVDDHEKGEYVYQLMTDVITTDVIESFSYVLIDDRGIRMETMLDVRLQDNTNTDLSDLVNTTELTGGIDDNLLVGSSRADTLAGGEGNDHLYGGAGIDIIDAGLGNDLIVGGQGSDSITGGEGGDVFAFLRGDADEPAVDIITDFNVTEGDSISLYDLLEGANDDNIGDYLVSLADESGKATLSVASDGETVDQKIVFEDKSLAELSDDVLGIASGSGAEILEKMLLDGMLVTQQ